MRKPTAQPERKPGQAQAIAAAKQAAATAATRNQRPEAVTSRQNKNFARQPVEKVQDATSRVLAALPQAAKKPQGADLAQRVTDQAARQQRIARNRLNAAESQPERQALTEGQMQERDRRLRDLEAKAPARAAYAESQRGGAPGSAAAKKERDRALRDAQTTAPARAAYANSQRGGAPGRAARDQRVRIAQGQVDYNDALRGQPVGERTAEIVEAVGPDKIRVTNGRTGRSAVHNIPLSGYVRPATSFRADLVGSAVTGPTISLNKEVKVQEWRPVPGGQHPGVSVGTTADGSIVAVSTGKLPDDVARQLNNGGSMQAGHNTADGRNVTVYRPPTQYEANVKDLAKQWSEVAPNGAVDGKQLGEAVAGTAAIVADGTIGLQQGNLYGSGKDCGGNRQNCGELALEAGLALLPLKGGGGLLKGATGVARGTEAVEAVGKAVLPKTAPRIPAVPRVPTSPARPGTGPSRILERPQTGPQALREPAPQPVRTPATSPATQPRPGTSLPKAPEGPPITPRIPRPPWPTDDPDTAQPQPRVPDKPTPRPVPVPGPRETPWHLPRPVEPHPQQTPPGVPRPVEPAPGPGETPQIVPQPQKPAPGPRETPWDVPRPDLPDLPDKPVAPTGPRPLPHPGERDMPETSPDFDDPGRPATLPDPEIPAFPRTAPQPHTDNPRPQPYHRSAEQPGDSDPRRETTRPGDSRAESDEIPRTGKDGNPSDVPEKSSDDPGKNDSCSRTAHNEGVCADPFTLRRTEALAGKSDMGRVDKLVASMQDGGWNGDPILVAKQGDDIYVIDGHHRVAAAKRAGISVPYRVLSQEELLEWHPGGMDEVVRTWAEVGPDRITNRHKRRR